MFSEYTKNLVIYYYNLSTYYVICVFMSVTAIILTWMFHTKEIDAKLESENHDETTTEDVDTTKEEKQCALTDAENMLASYKNRKKITIEKLAELTVDQLEEEKKAEREQLVAILQLLKQQEDKFQVGSMEELEGQLKLYR